MIFLLSLIGKPSIIANSAVNVQYGLVSCLSSFLLDGQPLMIYSLVFVNVHDFCGILYVFY